MLKTKMLQDMKQNKLQFLSILLMAFIGVFIFTGVGGEWSGVEASRKEYYKETNLADGWIWGEGFSSDDVRKVKNIDGVKDAQRRFYAEVKGVDKDSPTVFFYGLEKNEICKPYIVEGAEFDTNAKGKMWLDVNFAKAKNLSLGDSYTFDFEGTQFTLQIAGLIYSSELQYYSNQNDLWPDYNHVGFVYAPVSSIPIKDYLINYIEKSDKSVLELIDEFGKDNAELLKYKDTLGKFSKDFIVRQLKRADDSEFSDMLPYTQITLTSDVPAADLSNKIDNVLKDNYAVYTTRSEMTGIQMLTAEMEQHKMVGSLMPILFLAIAVLAIVTSMNRLINTQRTQIGTLKALGFSNGAVLRHYVGYGFWTSTAGAVLGLIIGPLTIPHLFYPSMSSYFTLPQWKSGWDKSFFIVTAATIVVCTLTTFLSTAGLLRESPAQTLRPKPPKKYKLTRFEKSKLWSKLGFNLRWSWRTVTRGKMKTVMGIVGTIGCMALLICAFSSMDSMTDMEKWMYSEIQVQQVRYMLDGETTVKDAEKIKADVNGEIIMTDAIEVKANGIKKTANINAVDGKGCFYLTTADRKQVTPNDSTIALSQKTANLLGVSAGDEIEWHIYTSDKWVKSKITLINRTPMTQGITVTRNTLEKYGYEYKPTYVDSLTMNEGYSNPHITNALTQEDMHGFWDNYMESMNLMVSVLIFFACILSVVVLYNLGSLTFTERIRDNATLKVLGFGTDKILKTSILQNIIYSAIGVVLGIPVGLGFTYFMLNFAGDEFDMMIAVSPKTFIICTAITLGVSVLVSLMFRKKIRKLNMTESLKGVE